MRGFVAVDPRAMAPFGAALLAFEEGDAGAELVMRRDDGLTVALPVSHFFRPFAPDEPIESLALERCRGRVLDCGAGTGRHALVLQERGLDVTAIDVCPEAVAVMVRRGVRDARRADALALEGGPWDTVLLLGHAIGLVETIAGLDAFLARLRVLVAPGGRVLLDSVDVRATDEPVHLAYHERNRREGRYVGEIRVDLEFRGLRGPAYGWLQVDRETLAGRAAAAGWSTVALAAGAQGEALYELERGAGG